MGAMSANGCDSSRADTEPTAVAERELLAAHEPATAMVAHSAALPRVTVASCRRVLLHLTACDPIWAWIAYSREFRGHLAVQPPPA